MRSIRNRLLLSLLAGLLVSAAVMGAVAYADTVDELHDLFTDNLRRMAVVLKGQAFADAAAGQAKSDVGDIDTGELEESYVIQIWGADGALLRSSRPDLPLPLQKQEGLGRLKRAREWWETYTLKAGHDGYIQIAQPQRIVATMIGESAAFALVPFIALFLLMAVGGWIAVGRSLSPLNRLSKAIGRWDVGAMKPLAEFDAPAEIEPIVVALNTMLRKLDRAMAVQQQFTADSAHELRTPLTAVRLQLENVVRAPSEAERGRAVEKLAEGIDRCIHLAGQLLTASRSMAVKTRPERRDVDLQDVTAMAVAGFAPLAAHKQVRLLRDGEDDCRLEGDEEGLRALVNNLIDNAVRYTPRGGAVAVGLAAEAAGIVLTVSDTGPGIPEAERERVFDRFYRIPGTPSTGSGLGLAIVRAVAGAHGATVSIAGGATGSTPGLTVRVTFPLSPAQ